MKKIIRMSEERREKIHLGKSKLTQKELKALMSGAKIKIIKKRR